MLQIALAVSIAAVVGLPALLAPTIWSRLISRALAGNARSIWILAGFLAGATAYAVVRRRPRIRFLDCLQHELSHLTVGLLLGCSPSHLSVHDASGHVGYSIGGALGRTRAFLITIAPYWMSPALSIPALLSLAVPHNAPAFWLGGISAMFGVALAASIGQIHFGQPDLRKYGVVLPIIAAVWLWTALGVIESSVVSSGSFRAIPAMYHQSWNMLPGALRSKSHGGSSVSDSAVHRR